MGAFNEWVKGSFLERPENRRVVTVALNILQGAAVLLRAASLRCQDQAVSRPWPRVAPLPLKELQLLLHAQRADAWTS
jgi:hypothetical protein